MTTITQDTAPAWLAEILDTLDFTDGINAHFCREEQGKMIVTISYGDETLEFTADTDGELHGATYDGIIHDMTTSEDVQWWIASQLYARLQEAKRSPINGEMRTLLRDIHEEDGRHFHLDSALKKRLHALLYPESGCEAR